VADAIDAIVATDNHLSPLAKEAIAGMKESIAPYLAAHIEHKLVLQEAVREMEERTLIAIPSYTFDMDYFYAEPSEERFMESLYPDDDKIVFLVLDKDAIAFRLDAGKEGEQWQPRLHAPTAGQEFPRLREIALDTNNTVRHFNIFSKEYYLVECDGNRVAYDVRGNASSLGELCSSTVSIMSKIKEAIRTRGDRGLPIL
jgi:hypothetical protein